MADYPRSLGPALRPLEPLLGDPAVTAIHINGPDDVWARRGDRLERADVELSAGKVRVLADAIARAVEAEETAVRFGRRFAEGLAVLVVRPPAAPAGPVISLSRPPAGPPTVDDLVSWGGLTGDALARIGKALDDGAGMLVSGEDASSRKALLVALASALRDSERVVLVDDGSVHPPDLEHLVRLRVSDEPGASRAELFAAAARLGPDRVLIDELGAAELVALLLDAGDAYSGVVLAAPGATVEAAVERLLCIARGAASTGDPAPLLPACFGLVVVASPGGAAEPRVAEIGEISADPATGKPSVRLLFRRSGPGGELQATEFRPQRSATTRTPAVADEEDLPKGFRTTVATVEREEPPPPEEHDTASDLPPPPVVDPAFAAVDEPGPPVDLEPAPLTEPAAMPLPPPPVFEPEPPSPPPENPTPFEDRTNIIRMVPQELLDLEE